MKFKIRYADQIVGLFTIVAIVALVAVIFMLGSKQRWFARDSEYKTTFDTATGLAIGLPLQYKGFVIGKITSFKLNADDKVDVKFTVYEEYRARAKEGSAVELILSPIPIVPNQFLFHPGNGSELIANGSAIPRLDSAEGHALVASGKLTPQKRDDSLSLILAQINPTLENINSALAQLTGNGKGPLNDTIENVAVITDGLAESLGDTIKNVDGLTAQLEKMSKSPKGFVPALVDPDGTMFDNVETSLNAVAGTLNNVEDASSILKSQVPQIARLIEDLRVALVKGQDVLEALRNNPILKNGVPERVESDSSGTNSRNIEF
jgi:phospholipid/cholesterol/gamma-HCH transport system substrate-binding protein